eukprot:805708-Amphidinium_carterae.1
MECQTTKVKFADCPGDGASDDRAEKPAFDSLDHGMPNIVTTYVKLADCPGDGASDDQRKEEPKLPNHEVNERKCCGTCQTTRKVAQCLGSALHIHTVRVPDCFARVLNMQNLQTIVVNFPAESALRCSCAAIQLVVCSLFGSKELRDPSQATCHSKWCKLALILTRNLADSKGLDGPAKVIHCVDGVKDLISPEAKPKFGEHKRGASWDRSEEDAEWSVN